MFGLNEPEDDGLNETPDPAKEQYSHPHAKQFHVYVPKLNRVAYITPDIHKFSLDNLATRHPQGPM